MDNVKYFTFCFISYWSLIFWNVACFTCKRKVSRDELDKGGILTQADDGPARLHVERVPHHVQVADEPGAEHKSENAHVEVSDEPGAEQEWKWTC